MCINFGVKLINYQLFKKRFQRFILILVYDVVVGADTGLEKGKFL
mgnify:CR=1 FL=1